MTPSLQDIFFVQADESHFGCDEDISMYLRDEVVTVGHVRWNSETMRPP